MWKKVATPLGFPSLEVLNFGSISCPGVNCVSFAALRVISLRRRSAWKTACSRYRAIGICVPGAVVWRARDSVCAGIVFVGPVVQSARFGELEMC